MSKTGVSDGDKDVTEDEILTNKNPALSRADVLSILVRAAKRARAQDAIIIDYSVHGKIVTSGSELDYIVPLNAVTPPPFDDNKLFTDADLRKPFVPLHDHGTKILLSSNSPQLDTTPAENDDVTKKNNIALK